MPPIHIEINKDITPVTQKTRPVPFHLRQPLKDKLDYLVEQMVIEEPLGLEHGMGWVYNLVICGKKWDDKQIRMNLDTRFINKAVAPNKYLIPTVEQI